MILFRKVWRIDSSRDTSVVARVHEQTDRSCGSKEGTSEPSDPCQDIAAQCPRRSTDILSTRLHEMRQVVREPVRILQEWRMTDILIGDITAM